MSIIIENSLFQLLTLGILVLIIVLILWFFSSNKKRRNQLNKIEEKIDAMSTLIKKGND